MRQGDIVYPSIAVFFGSTVMLPVMLLLGWEWFAVVWFWSFVAAMFSLVIE